MIISTVLAAYVRIKQYFFGHQIICLFIKLIRYSRKILFADVNTLIVSHALLIVCYIGINS